MNLQDKIELLKNELESRNASPDASEVWNNIGNRLDAKRRKKKFILLSLVLMILATTFVFVWINNSHSASKTSSISSDNIVIVHSDNKGNKPADLNASQEREPPVSIDENKAMMNANPLVDAVPESSTAAHMRQSGGENKEKSTSLSGLNQARNLDMASKTNMNEEDKKSGVNNETDITSKDETVFKDFQSKDTQIMAEKDEIITEAVQDSTKEIKDETHKHDSTPQKMKRFVIRPYLGMIFNQLEPFSVPGKTYAYSLFNNYSGGMFLDYYINQKTMLTFNFGYIKLPSKIEFLRRSNSPYPDIVKVLNTNNLIFGLEFSKFNAKKNICFNIGNQITISGKKRNFIEAGMNGKLVYNQQKELPQDIQDNYFSKLDFLVNAGLSLYKNRSVLRINYYQGLIDVSRTTKLFNPHAFVQVNYAYRLFRF
jgi:hypothetical protein